MAPPGQLPHQPHGPPPWLFVSERGQPPTRQALNDLVAVAAGRAGLPGVQPHALRHFRGLAPAGEGHDRRPIRDHL
ncbi:MAG TPA: hypothetical protein VFG47_00380, partial [Geminicoccaceae bacterium]|nr:hypothetical protein [Geminicoccaceae bacterium]